MKNNTLLLSSLGSFHGEEEWWCGHGREGNGREREGREEERREKRRKRKASLPNLVVVVVLQPARRRYYPQLSSSNITGI